MSDTSSEFDRVAALTSELEMVRLQAAETERDLQQKIQRMEAQIQEQHVNTLNSPAIDPVEHQAMRQELESLKQTVTDLRQEVEDSHHQSRQSEDAIEDKNDQIERLNQEIDMLRGDLEEAEYKRQEADEGKKQIEQGMYKIQEEMEQLASSREVVEMQQIDSNGGGAKHLLVGFLIGFLLLLAGLEAFSFMQGKGELLALIQSDAKVEVRKVVVAAKKPDTAKPDAPKREVVSVPASRQPETSPEPSVVPPTTVAEVASTGEQDVEQKPENIVEKSAAHAVEQEVSAEVKAGPQVVQEQEAGHQLVGFIGAKFNMGNRTGAFPDEAPYHEVVLKPFMIGVYEVTFAQYDRFARATGRDLPSDNGWGRGDRPVVNVTWEDARAYAAWLSRQTGKKYRLPTEAEWEFAAAGGSDSTYWWGYTTGKNKAICFNCGTQWDGRSTAPVGQLEPNPYGVHDTAGNAQEWVRDCYKTNYRGVPADGGAVELSPCGERVARGSAFNKPAVSMRTSKRTRFVATTKIPSLGFRIARDL